MLVFLDAFHIDWDLSPRDSDNHLQDGSPHRNEHNPQIPHRDSENPVSREVLDLIELTIKINPHGRLRLWKGQKPRL